MPHDIADFAAPAGFGPALAPAVKPKGAVAGAPALSPKAQLVRTEKKGRLFVARERIEAGELVVLDRSGAMVPETARMDAVCLRCCAPATSSRAEACDECRFPYCSPACKREDAAAHGAECDLPPFLLDIAQDEAVPYQYLWLAARVLVASQMRRGDRESTLESPPSL
eukprot:tig00021108_g18297.t1